MWNSNAGYTNDPVEPEYKQPGAFGNTSEDKAQFTMPITLSHIDKFTRPNDGLVLYNKTIPKFTTVAMISEILDQTATRIQLKLYDGTKGSPIDLIYIIGEGNIPFDPQPGKYVRVYGTVKFNENKPFITPYYIGPISDINEITMHIVEVIKEMMVLERCQNQPSTVQTTMQRATSKQINDPLPNVPNLPNTAKHILKYLRDTKGQIHFNVIAENFRHFPKEQIISELESLRNEGLAYNGDDEDIWTTE